MDNVLQQVPLNIFNIFKKMRHEWVFIKFLSMKCKRYFKIFRRKHKFRYIYQIFLLFFNKQTKILREIYEHLILCQK